MQHYLSHTQHLRDHREQHTHAQEKGTATLSNGFY